MATPQEAQYLSTPIMKAYVRSVFEDKEDDRHPLQAKIDSFVQKVVDHYFTIPGLISETQSYPDSKTSLQRTNITISLSYRGKLKKVVVIEAKRFPRPQGELRPNWYITRQSVWNKAKTQLRKYFELSRKRDKWSKDMLKVNSHKLGDYQAPSLSEEDQKRKYFSIRVDSLLVEEVLLDIKALVMPGLRDLNAQP
ncbi:hypothetical protein UA08_05961 [Talaromyces atroroseus]|uniref:Uncharacterized protein n=1 Tax=Talaromyces atroroseus TaxID=1441469 RepID=A0A225AW20_TALAT|nr:hypothetical protein UA08_05961 [Talaromyces atroroseus]OKL59156.1 hypothetical protein UA08_05961 [Talaromyces atroroseus]